MNAVVKHNNHWFIHIKTYTYLDSPDVNNIYYIDILKKIVQNKQYVFVTK